jgi:hypothetical protein
MASIQSAARRQAQAEAQAEADAARAQAAESAQATRVSPMTSSCVNLRA